MRSKKQKEEVVYNEEGNEEDEETEKSTDKCPSEYEDDDKDQSDGPPSPTQLSKRKNVVPSTQASL